MLAHRNLPLNASESQFSNIILVYVATLMCIFLIALLHRFAPAVLPNFLPFSSHNSKFIPLFNKRVFTRVDEFIDPLLKCLCKVGQTVSQF